MAKSAYVQGEWNGQQVEVWNTIGGAVLTEEQMRQAFSGRTVMVNGVSYGSGRHDNVPVHIAYYEADTGEERIGLRYDFPDRISGRWRGEETQLRGEVMGHAITDEEARALFAGGRVHVEDLRPKGAKTPSAGDLYIGSYQDRPSIEVDFDQGDVWEGTGPDGRKARIPKTFKGHRISEQEAHDLFAGATVKARDLVPRDPSKGHYGANLSLGEYNGRPSLQMSFSPYVLPDAFKNHRFTPEEIRELEEVDAKGRHHAIQVDGLISAAGKPYSATFYIGPDQRGRREGDVLNMTFDD